MKNILLIIIVVVFTQCKSKQSQNSAIMDKDVSKSEVIDTIDFKYTFDSRNLKGEILDSIGMITWTDKFMPRGVVEWRLYTAYLVYKKSLNKDVHIKVFHTYADDWTRMHLITNRSDSTLINIKEIGENMSYLLDQTDSFDWYMQNDAMLIIKNDSVFQLKQIETTTKDYYNETLKDSIYRIERDSIFIIDRNGKIKNRL